MADPACVVCNGLGEIIEHDPAPLFGATPYPRIVCDCDGACETCGGRGFTFADDDFDGDQPIECVPCAGTGRNEEKP